MNARIATMGFLAVGCATATPTAAPEATFGAPLSAASPVKLGSVLATPREFDGKTVKIEGKVSAVCQRKGCWMTLSEKPDGPRVRVTFEDYGFFVPRDLSGRRVVAEGTFRVAKLSEAQAQHYADDEAATSGGAARQVAPDQMELSLVATGVALLR